ncbi:MAG: LCP family protein [Spirochaetia bacterium]
MDIRKIFSAKGDKLIYLILIFMVGSAVYFYVEGRVNPVNDLIKRDQDMPILFVVHSKGKPLIISYYVQNSHTKRGSFFDIPANTAATLRSLKRIDRIDTIFNPRSPDRFVQQVTQLLGLEQRPFYFFMDTEELSFIVDLIRGVEIFITNPINKQQDKQAFSIPSGSVLLDGAKASEYLLLKEDQEAVNRWVDRRQRFMGAFLRRLVHQVAILSHPKVINQLKSRIVTDMNDDALVSFFQEVSLLDTENVGYQRVAGSVRMVESVPLLFPNYEGQLLQETIRQTRANLASTENAGIAFLPSKIEVQNATVRNGLGTRTAQIFAGMGYDVVSIRNATQTSPYTVVIDLSGNLESAQKIASVIRCSRVYSLPPANEDDINVAMDVRIILGNDFDGRYVRQLN